MVMPSQPPENLGGIRARKIITTHDAASCADKMFFGIGRRADAVHPVIEAASIFSEDS